MEKPSPIPSRVDPQSLRVPSAHAIVFQEHIMLLPVLLAREDYLTPIVNATKYVSVFLLNNGGEQGHTFSKEIEIGNRLGKEQAHSRQ